MVMGINGMGVVLGPIIGPTFAGVVAEHHGWRWVFMMLLPVAVVALLDADVDLAQRHRELLLQHEDM